MKPWKTLSRTVILDHSKYLVVENHIVELPDGRVIRDWPWLVMPDYANVVAVTHDERFLVFRQRKYSIQGLTLALVGGYLEPGEEPLSAAKRELLEETGYEAEDWTCLGHYPIDGNRGAGTAHLFLAREARQVAQASADDLEEHRLLLLSRAEIEAALADKQFKLLPWATNVALSLLYLYSGNSH
jgi:ADP-ribose pyrophosphatase